MGRNGYGDIVEDILRGTVIYISIPLPIENSPELSNFIALLKNPLNKSTSTLSPGMAYDLNYNTYRSIFTRLEIPQYPNRQECITVTILQLSTMI